MVPPCGMGISCKRSPSPGQPGRKTQAQSGDFSVVERAPFREGAYPALRVWWDQQDSNLRHSACKADALTN